MWPKEETLAGTTTLDSNVSKSVMVRKGDSILSRSQEFEPHREM